MRPAGEEVEARGSGTVEMRREERRGDEREEGDGIERMGIGCCDAGGRTRERWRSSGGEDRVRAGGGADWAGLAARMG